ncbi:MAG: hypothetical protein LBV49_07915 [Azonexus sp.]|jgi:hypothetical protein|nr:hypothetical protein [Azonexus sp.]
MRSRLFLLFFAAALAAPAFGGPAPWYWWFSRDSDQRVCWQTSPGEGWIKEPQPFRDARCRDRIQGAGDRLQ